ncbi:MAG: histidine kinase [Pseudomonadota bacterium]
MVADNARIDRPDAAEWRRVARLAFIYWVAIYVWSNVSNVIAGAGYFPNEIPGDGLVALTGVLVGLGGYAIIRRVRGLHPLLRWLVRGGAVLAGAAIYIGVGYGLYLLGWLAMPRAPWTLQQWAWQIWFWAVPHAMWLALAEILEQGRAGRERDARLSTALVAARDAEIRALHYQVNPHFLYNALNSISALVLEGRPREADRMILQLSGYYRANLQADPLKQVRLADELAQQGLYLEIERTRFADRLRIVVDMPEELADALVPGLILQPLVENAAKHGVNDPGEETVITVTARANGGDLVLSVSDNGPGSQASGGTGIGLQNVRGRLAAIYQEAASVETRTDGAGFTSTIRLPLARVGQASAA